MSFLLFPMFCLVVRYSVFILPHVTYVLKLLLLCIIIAKAELEHQIRVLRVLFKNLQCPFLMRFKTSWLISKAAGYKHNDNAEFWEQVVLCAKGFPTATIVQGSLTGCYPRPPEHPQTKEYWAKYNFHLVQAPNTQTMKARYRFRLPGLSQ